jgi:hypothetical protein
MPPMPVPVPPPVGVVPLHLRAEVGEWVRLAQIGRDRHRLRRSSEANGDHTDRGGGSRFLSET